MNTEPIGENSHAAHGPAGGGNHARGRGDLAATPLLRVEGLTKHFPILRGILRRQVGAVKAVDGVDFHIQEGETLGLVGESGCGKSTAGRVILRLGEATAGRIWYRGEDITLLKGKPLRSLRRRMQMVFQDPQESLNPRMTVGSIVGEPLLEHGVAKGRALAERVGALLESVGLAPNYANRYPHEFSGGQRQRIGMARALALRPEFIICDEPIAALDVSIQAQVVNLLEDLRERLNLTYLFISHDLAMVRHIADRVAVMYLGKIVELAPVRDLYENPRHPYTQALLSAAPGHDPRVEARRERILLQGDVPSPAAPPPGCRFNTRCPKAQALCSEQKPAWREVRGGHSVACHFAEG